MLFEKAPLLFKELILEKNPEFDPYSLKSGSNKKAWWKCSNGHEYYSKVCHRTLSGTGCPFCSRNKLDSNRSLAICNPKLAKEFHPKKNGRLNPLIVSVSSGKKIWWFCSKDPSHEWISTVDNRNKGNGCPYCAGKKVNSSNCLATLYPSLIDEWDFSLNLNLSPNQLRPQSNVKVYWRCLSKPYHIWKCSIAHRVNGTGCPFCSNQKLHEKESAYYQLPKKILKEFKQECNPKVKLKNISIPYAKAIVWKCSVNSKHLTWKACINTRMKGGNNCPECEPFRTNISFEKSVAFLYPHLLSEWHKDNLLTLKKVTPGSGRKGKWICKYRKSHTYEMRVAHRVRGHGCPKCRNAPTLPELRLYSELDRYFSPELHYKVGNTKIDVYLKDIKVAIEWDSYYFHKDRLKSDEKKTIFLLQKDMKIIRIRDVRLKEINISNKSLSIIASSSDEICHEIYKSILRKILDWGLVSESKLKPALNDLHFVNNQLYEKLRLNRGRHFVNQLLNKTHPHVIKFWDFKNNGQLQPNEVAPFSREVVRWICNTCGYEWKDKILNVTTRKNVCSCCSKQTVGPKYNLLKLYPNIASELIDENPQTISPHSAKKLKWKCSKCHYIWVQSVNRRTGKGKCGCPRCAGKILIFENSIAGISPEAVKAWDYEKNDKHPQEVFPGTHVKYFFRCDCGSSIQKRPRNFIVRHQRKCIFCLRKKRK